MRMNRALESPPYNLIIHSAPFSEEATDFYHWHVELMPKLTRTAGFEWGTGFYINPTSPEEAAEVLRTARSDDGYPQGVGLCRLPLAYVRRGVLMANPAVWYFKGPASGNNSVVECDLAKVEVAGSNPVSRSNFSPTDPTPSRDRVRRQLRIEAPVRHGD